MTEGKTLAELNVKEGDVVECVSHLYRNRDTLIIGHHYTVDKTGCVRHGDGGRGLLGKFRIISRANDWQICPPDYEEQTHHECTYHMGIPVAYREIVLEDAEETTPLGIARGKTRNGKPVGQWVIDMDDVG